MKALTAAKHLFEKYERHISASFFLVGFVIDSLTLRRIDRLFDNLVLLSYFFTSALGIAVINMYWGGKLKSRHFERVVVWIPLAIQFAFGGLMSGLVVFYSRSGSLWASWPFMLALVAMFAGNELFRNYYLRLAFQVSILYFTSFLLSIFYVPMALGAMGPGVFVLSGLVSLAVIGAFLFLLWRRIPKRVSARLSYILIGIVGIFAGMNALYFLNVIPPIPLSLKGAGIYHDVRKVDGGYELDREKGGEAGLFRRARVHVRPNETLYAYTAVFAPTRLSTTVSHEWQRMNEETGEWVTASTVKFPIAGGRDGGYRGYSLKAGVSPGLWRVNVKTGRGQVIGRLTFEALASEGSVEVETVPGT